MQQPRTESIQWREWGEEAFSLAKREGKPVLLTLTATWCHWCHVMDQTSYSHPRVIELVNSRFVPIRVDVDRRPDISYRYNQGGFPSVAFLDAEGELITGRVYTPPREMVQLLEQVSTQYAECPGQLAKTPPEDKPQRHRDAEKNKEPLWLRDSVAKEGGEAGEPALQLVLHRLQETYDADFGGFGLEPKQPPWEALKLLLALDSRSGVRVPRLVGTPLLAMVSTALDSMSSGLYDQKDQGFFRYSVARDWRVPHYEKMLSTNANLGSVYLEAYQLAGRKRYKDIAIGALSYLLTTLHDQGRGLFYACQDAAEEYYRLPWKDREKARKPAIDRTFYTGLNAMAASSLTRAYGVLGSRLYLRAASRALDVLWDEGWEPDAGLRHVIAEIPPTLDSQATDHRLQATGRDLGTEARSSDSVPTSVGMQSDLQGESGDSPRFLADHVLAAQAFLDLYQTVGSQGVGASRCIGTPLQCAVELVQCIRKLFSASDGGFYDTSAGLKSPQPSSSSLPAPDYRPKNVGAQFIAPEAHRGRGGILLPREKPVLENSLLAEVLVQLHYITGESQYLALARETLETFNQVVPGSGYLGPKGSRRMEEDEERLFLPAGSAWGRAWDMLANGPVHLVLVGASSHPRTRSLWRASLRTYVPHRILQLLDPERDADRIASLGFPAGREPALYVCMGSRCLAPITTPEGVRALRASRPWAAAGLAEISSWAI